MATQTSSSKPDDTTCVVKFDGDTAVTGVDGVKYEMKDGYYIKRVEVDQRENAPTFFSVEFANLNLNQESSTDGLGLVDVFKPGMEVEITLGLTNQAVICNGEISYVEPRFGRDRRAMVVSGYDKTHRLTRGTESRTWSSSDGWTQDQEFKTFIEDVIKKSQGREGEVSDALSADVDSLTAKVEWFGQYESSAWQFLQSLGLATGLTGGALDHSTAGKLQVKKSGPTGSTVATICREKPDPAGSALAEEAKFRLSVVRQVKKVEVRGWDHKLKQSIKGEAAAVSAAFDGDSGPAFAAETFYGGSSSGSILTVTDCPVSSKDEADQLAQAIIDQLAMEYMRAEVTIPGDARLTPGDIVELKGYGKRYSGTWLVSGALHEMNEGAYKTHLELARNASPTP